MFYVYVCLETELAALAGISSSRALLAELDEVDWLSSAHNLYEEELIHEMECCEVKRVLQPSTCYHSLSRLPFTLLFFLPTLLSPLSLLITQCLATCLVTLSFEVFPIRCVCPILHVTFLLLALC